MITAIYARKSTEQTGVSEEAKSVTRQIEHATAYAAKNGWTVAEECIFSDDGISGAEFGDRRPGLKRLLKQLAPRAPFSILVLSELSRLGREQFEVSYLLKQLSIAGVTVHCYLDGKAVALKTPIDKARLMLDGYSNEDHRTKTAERVHDAMARKARAGQVTGGRCFGYDNVDVAAPMPDTFGRPIRSHVERRTNPAQAAVVEKIFRLYAEGKGFRTIAALLNDEGAPCPRPSAGRPIGWAHVSVRQVLLRSVYKGEILWNRTKKRDQWGQQRQRPRDDESEWIRTPAEHLRIVSDDVWNAVQARLRAMRATYLRATGGQLMGRPLTGMESKYLLTGLAECMLCKPTGGGTYGGSLTPRSRAHGRHRAYYYACMSNVGGGQRRCANDLHLPMDATHRALWESLKDTLLNRELLCYSVEKAIEKAQARQEEQARGGRGPALEDELATIEQELARLSTAIATGGQLPALLAALQEREHRRTQLRQDLTTHSAFDDLARLDLRLLDRDLKAKIAEWTTLLHSVEGNMALARQLLRTLLTEKLHFTPDLAAGTCRFVGRSTVGRILQGVVPAKALVSPTGFEPVLLP